jgi:protocatechuate 3,4-dioxygenase beta subunit
MSLTPAARPLVAKLGPIRTPGTAVISGRVIDAHTGRPVSEAIVAVGNAETAPAVDKLALLAAGPGHEITDPRFFVVPRVLTDESGSFTLAGLPGGSFNLLASKEGYRDAFHGQDSSTGQPKPVVLIDGATVTQVVMALARPPVISGRVLNDLGEPLAGLPITAYRRSWIAGTQRDLPIETTTLTNDRGEYRLTLPESGEYRVHMVVRSSTPRPRRALSANLLGSLLPLGGGAGAMGGPAPIRLSDGHWVHDTAPGRSPLVVRGTDGLTMYRSLYFPSAREPDAAIPISIADGEERPSIDMVAAPERVSAIGGSVLGAPDAGDIVLHLVPGRSAEPLVAAPVAVTATDATGRFTFAGVPEGDYTIQFVRASRAAGGSSLSIEGVERNSALLNEVRKLPVLWGAGPVTVSGPSLTVNIRAQRSLTMTGSLVEAGSSNLRCRLDRADALVTTVLPKCSVAADGAIIADGILPGSYVFDLTDAKGSSVLRSVTVNGSDMTDKPLPISSDVAGIVVSSIGRPSALSGTVFVDAPQDSVVLVFPTDQNAWKDFGPSPRRLKRLEVSHSGTFGIAFLPAGDYFVALVSTEVREPWAYAAKLKQLLTSARRITVRAGEDHHIDLSRARQMEYGPSRADGDPSGPFVPPPDDDLQQAGTGWSMVGRVMDGVDAVPVRRARVVAFSTTEFVVSVTDDFGEFFMSVPAGYYTVFAEKPGYLRAYHGSRVPGSGPGVAVAIGVSSQSSSIVIQANRAGSISGRVHANGHPLAGATVHVINRSGRPTVHRQVKSDDRGYYRVPDLPPAAYVVAAVPAGPSYPGGLYRSAPAPSTGVRPVDGAQIGQRGPGVPAGPAVVFAPVYYPGTANASDAGRVTLALGQQVVDVDFGVTAVQVARVEGVVVSPNGEPVKGLSVRLRPSQTIPSVDGQAIAVSVEGGRFSFNSVAPGEYEVIATATLPSHTAGPATIVSARLELDVHPADSKLVTLALVEHQTITGSLEFPAGFSPSTRPSILLRPVGSPGVDLAAVLRSGRAFDIVGVAPGRYHWHINSVTGGGVVAWPNAAIEGTSDTLNGVIDVASGLRKGPFTIRFSTRPTQVVGTLKDARGTATTAFHLLLFPTDEGRWYADSPFIPPLAQPATDGTFRFVGVAAGEYWLAAVIVNDEATLDIKHPDFLRQAASVAVRVAVAAGETARQDLIVGR